MSLRILVKDGPIRSIAITTPTHALLLHHNSANNGTTIGESTNVNAGNPNTARFVAEFSSLQQSSTSLDGFKPLYPSNIYGTLGLINVNSDCFLGVITSAPQVAFPKPGETIQRIGSVEFYCLNRPDFESFEGYHVHHDEYTPENEVEAPEGAYEHPCQAFRKLLSSGTFYYSTDFDLTTVAQKRFAKDTLFDIDSFDDGFLWNSYMIKPLLGFRSRLAARERAELDASHILTSAIRGYTSTITVPASSSPLKEPGAAQPSSLTLISRLSCRRAGTRFNARGIDDDGNVANFVETETIYYHPCGLYFSYAQVRGSIPLFWEQTPGLLPNQQKISISRPPEATQPAFDKHFEELELKYGSVHVLNLLSESKPGEVELTGRYNFHIGRSSLNKGRGSDHAMLTNSQFDFHAETKGPNGYEAAQAIRFLIQDIHDSFAYYLAESETSHDVSSKAPQTRLRLLPVLQQEGIFRTNCLDCLDRTNLIQTIISQMAVESFLGHRGERALSDFWMRHSSLWADNGDSLSKIYAGTGALKTSFTRHGKMSLSGAIADVRKSATRLYMNNFADKGRQIVIDTLLGRMMNQIPVVLYDPISESVNAELTLRAPEFTSQSAITLWLGTFNLNGRVPSASDDLSHWFCPDAEFADLFVFGFQEIVELSPQQIMSTDPARKAEWEIRVGKQLNSAAHRAKKEEYVLLRSGQLVGAALLIFVRKRLLKSIKNVEGSVKKTGISGLAGNKGAVAIRMDISDTSICFVTAHLAAGFANYDERNRDYRTISHGLRFQRNRGIDDHSCVFWLGDFNYRIGLDNERVRRFIREGDLDTLYRNDQLALAMGQGYVFPFYREGIITFLPTYKYDNGTDVYDSSEKQRIPAWCDRILWKAKSVTQTTYTTAPLMFSDHRPVLAIFSVTIDVIDEGRRAKIAEEISARKKDGFSFASVLSGRSSEDADDEEYASLAPGLPPASSERERWWIANGMSARADFSEKERAGMVPNEKRLEESPNPFVQSEESDWVAVERPVPVPKGKPMASESGADVTSSPKKEGKAPPALPVRSKPLPPVTPSVSATQSAPVNLLDQDDSEAADLPALVPRR